MTDLPRGITDPEVQALVVCAESIRVDYEQEGPDPWQDSPFGWIRSKHSTTKGKIGEKLIAAWCKTNGFDVRRSPDREADCIIEGYRFEIKFSTPWKDGGTGVFAFQQIRDQDYDYLFALGVSPFDAHAWVLPKAILRERVIGRMGQHTGSGSDETDWLRFKVGQEYEWMEPYGGSLAAVREVLSELGTRPPI